jgi:MOSC domain-containing protein YiiM
VRILSIQVGLPKVYAAAALHGGSWTTATFKEHAPGPLRLSFLGLEGDGQADLENHGGRDKAVLVYPQKHYPLWQAELGIPNFTNGALGENFTVADGAEEDVCIGDQYAVGNALVEVSQPRQPCWKQAQRWGIKDLVPRIVKTGRTGWYVRVLREGVVEEGMDLSLVGRPNPQWTIAAANAVYHNRTFNAARLRALASVELLSTSWRSDLEYLLQGGR